MRYQNMGVEREFHSAIMVADPCLPLAFFYYFYYLERKIPSLAMQLFTGL